MDRKCSLDRGTLIMRLIHSFVLWVLGVTDKVFAHYISIIFFYAKPFD